MRPLGLIFDNFGLKVLALGMAWAVWFMVSQSLSSEQPVRLHVALDVADPDAVRATAKDPDLVADGLVVTVRVSGPARAVAEFQRFAEANGATIHIGPDLYPPEFNTERRFGLGDLDIPDVGRYPEVRVVNMEPETVAVRLERMETRAVPLARPEVVDPPLGVNVVITRWDEVANVRAAAVYLKDQLSSIKTTLDPAGLKQLHSSMADQPTFSGDVPLRVIPLQAPLFELVDPDKPLMARVDLTQVEARSFTVPVQILRTAGAATGTVKFSDSNTLDERLQSVYVPGADGGPPSLNLLLEGSPSSIGAVDPAKLRVFVLEDEMGDAEVLSNLQVYVAGLPFGVRMRHRITLAVERER